MISVKIFENLLNHLRDKYLKEFSKENITLEMARVSVTGPRDLLQGALLRATWIFKLGAYKELQKKLGALSLAPRS